MSRASLQTSCVLWLRRIVFLFAFVIALLLTVWSAGALYFDSPFPALRVPAGAVYFMAVLAALLLLRRRHMGLAFAFTGFAMVAVWWFSLQPSSDRNWQLD